MAMAGYEQVEVRFEETMVARGFALRTRQAYTQAVRRFDRFLGEQSLERVGIRRLADYQRRLAKDGVCFSTFNTSTCALRFFFRHVLGRVRWDYARFPYRREPVRLPQVASPREVRALIDGAPSLKFRALFMTAYGCGLRLAEIQALRPRHVDARRMVVHVQNGKGGRDRYVMLPRRLLETLELYWRREPPTSLIFEGQVPGRPVSQRTISAALIAARARAGVTKHVTLHGLRHAFGTHLIEAGVGVPVVQQLLGHRSLASTQVYVHVSRTQVVATTSPLDQLDPSICQTLGPWRPASVHECPDCTCVHLPAPRAVPPRRWPLPGEELLPAATNRAAQLRLPGFTPQPQLRQEPIGHDREDRAR